MGYKRSSSSHYNARVRRLQAGSRGRLSKGFSRSDMSRAEKAFMAHSERSKGQDLVRMAPIAGNLEVWLKSPGRYDIPGIDTPDAMRVFGNKSKRAQAIDLAKAAKRVPLEIWVKATNRTDLAGVDTKNAKFVRKPSKPLQRFRVVPKRMAEKLEEKRKGRKLPTKKEILQRATEKRLEKQVKEGLPAITPEESELKETGEYQKAQQELMRGESSEVHSQIEAYVHDLNEQLEPEGFRVVPID